MRSRDWLVVGSTCGFVLVACASEDGQKPAASDGSMDTASTFGPSSSSGNVGSPSTASAATSATLGGGIGTTAGIGVTTGTGVSTGMGDPSGSGGTTGSDGATGTGGQSATSATEGTVSGASMGGSTDSGTTTGGGSGGATGVGGVGGTGGALPLGNPPVSSSGCGTATTVTTGKKSITSTGQERTYIIDVPANYDMNKPYRLFYTSHWIGSTSEAVRDQDYYFLKPLAAAANEPAIFVAPQSDGATWQEKDHALFDDILAYVKENLCVDTTRVFATGFSFGGMITYSLSVNHQKDIRAAVGIAPANYNIYVPPKTGEPIAWMQTTGLDDGTCPWVNGNSATQGAKYIAVEHATDNGCTVPTDIPTWQSGDHVCYDFEGCPAEYPVKACTFSGGHTNIANDSGSGANWIAQESWDFFMQF